MTITDNNGEKRREKHPIDPKLALIGARLRKAREHRGMSQVDIADAAGVTRASVSLWEAGRSVADQAKLEMAAKRLFVDYDWLVTGNRDKAPKLGSKASAETRRIARRTRTDASGHYRATAPLMDGSIPEMKDGIGAGAGYTGEDTVSEWWVFPRGRLSQLGVDSENLKAFPVFSDSFEPLISRGSVVFVDIAQKVPVDNMIFAISNGLSLLIKRCHTDMKRPRQLGLSDDVSAGSRRRIDWVKAADIVIVGRIVGQFSRL